MSRLIFLVKEAMVSLRRNLLVVVAAILTVFISLAVAMAALIISEIFRVNTLAWQEGVHVIAFLHDEGENGVPLGAHEALLVEVQGWEEVERAFYFDKQDAWAEYQELFAGQDQLLDIDPSILPASIRIELVDIDLHNSVRFKLEQNSTTVRQVAVASESIEQLNELSRVIRVGLLSASIVLGVAATVLIANTIRLAIYARRDEVAIMKLVGASNWFVRIPFLLEGFIEGLVGGAMAVFAVWIFQSSIADATASFVLFRFDVSNEFFFRWGALVLAFGALAGVIGSMLGLSRYLRDADGTGEPDIPTGF